jgi:hypothetical protein
MVRFLGLAFRSISTLPWGENKGESWVDFAKFHFFSKPERCWHFTTSAAKQRKTSFYSETRDDT